MGLAYTVQYFFPEFPGNNRSLMAARIAWPGDPSRSIGIYVQRVRCKLPTGEWGHLFCGGYPGALYATWAEAVSHAHRQAALAGIDHADEYGTAIPGWAWDVSGSLSPVYPDHGIPRKERRG